MTPPTDHLFGFLTELGAVAATAAVVGGAVLAGLYGRRASVSLAGEIHEIPDGFLVVARVRVRAVGILRVTFDETKGATVRLAEAYMGDDNLVHVDDEDPERSWCEESAFGQQYVDPGEELSTSVTFAPLRPDSSVVGWMAFVSVSAPMRFTHVRTAYWADQIFIPRPPRREIPS